MIPLLFRRYLLGLVVLSLCWTSCGKHLIVIEEVSDIPISDCALFSQTEHIVNDSAAYAALLLEMWQTPECENISTLPPIDFGEKTVMGKLTSVQNACSVSYQHAVFADSDAKQYIYRITALPEGDCPSNHSSMNWISIPKLPADYSVVYEVE